MGKVIPIVTLDSLHEERLPIEKEFVPHDILFPKISYKALDRFCRLTQGFDFSVSKARDWGDNNTLIIDPGFPLHLIVSDFNGDEDQWFCFVRTLKELVDDYMPEKLRKLIGTKITQSTEHEVRSMFRMKAAIILDAGGRPFHEELRYRLGIDHCIRKVHISCSLNPST